MRKKRTILWGGIVLLILIAAAWAYHLYVKPHESAADETTDFTISADSLYQQYGKDEHSADQKYLGKVIEVSGKLAEIQHSGNSEIWILSPQPGGGDQLSTVRRYEGRSRAEARRCGDGQGALYGLSYGCQSG